MFFQIAEPGAVILSKSGQMTRSQNEGALRGVAWGMMRSVKRPPRRRAWTMFSDAGIGCAGMLGDSRMMISNGLRVWSEELSLNFDVHNAHDDKEPHQLQRKGETKQQVAHVGSE